RVEVAPYKEDPMDFVLWKPSDAETPGWDSPWGRGRPGWHIECSAMSYELLGEAFDIHGGGNDLQFPHHENEIAQSRCMGHGFAKVWLHNEMLQVEGKKMSKSLGNFFTVRDLLDQGVSGAVIRFVFLQTHYRKPMDWTEKKRAEAETTLRKWAKASSGVTPAADVDEGVLIALSDDLNTAGAIARLHALFGNDDIPHLLSALNLMGIDLNDSAGDGNAPEGVSKLIEALLVDRAQARQNRDFARADLLRDGFVAAGVLVKDTKDGAEWELTSNFDLTKLEALK
ncbi:MAG: cysteine--tRNA ligase, partial [Boseongicola sp.]|nr:cysteine--tRNA ligase [Boseongicola sp.]